MRLLLAAVCLSGLNACPVRVPAPEIHSLFPDTGLTDATTPITIRGEHFYLAVTSNVDASHLQIQNGFSATLGNQPLLLVERLDSQTVTAEVPEGLPEGTYDLLLTTPAGHTATKTAAFVVAGSSGTGLTASLTASVSRASVGQTFFVVLQVTNPTDSDVLEVTPSPLTVEGEGSVATLTTPSPNDVPGRSTRVFAWELEATGAGLVSLAGGAEGRDALSGEPKATPTVTAAVAVETPPSLSGTLVVSPTPASFGDTVTLSLAVSNAGQATAAQLAPSTPVFTGTATVVPLTSPSPMQVAGGSTKSMHWTYRAVGTGTATCSVSAAGLDANSGDAVTLDALVSNELVVIDPTDSTALVTDPLEDGTTFAHVFSYHGQIHLGPNLRGNGMVRLDADGSSRQLVSFAFSRDDTDNVSSNETTSPLKSIGRPGCSTDTAHCGPDNEDGRSLVATGVLAETEWLVVGGSRSSGDLDYIYLTADTGTTPQFMYVDLSNLLGGQSVGISALHAHGGRLYIGVLDTGRKKPYLLALATSPSAPGLDATKPDDIVSLDADEMPALGDSASPAMVDSLIDFNDRLYAANNGGVVRATVTVPQPYRDAKDDWQDCTPTAAEYSQQTSITATETAYLSPHQKAVPIMAAFAGRLYLARNTEAGPQLWCCTPTLSGDAEHCDSEDWTLLAPNDTGDATLSQLNNPSNSHITLVRAAGAALYVGFDNADQGVVVIRSRNQAPSTTADFEGAQGCRFNDSPTCEGIGGNGFGDVTFTRIASSTTADGKLYVLVGDGATRVALFTLP